MELLEALSNEVQGLRLMVRRVDEARQKGLV